MNGYFQADRDLLGSMGKDGILTAADFRVMMIAMRDSKLPGDLVALGIDYVAGGTGLDRSTVIRSRRRLVQIGYLVPGGFGQRGLAQFAVATGGVNTIPQTVLTGGVDATPGGVHATCRTDATGGVGATGTGGVDATGTGGVHATQQETGNIETTAYAQNDENPPRRSASADDPQTQDSESKPKDKSFAQGNQTPPQSPSPDSAGGEMKPSVPKVIWDGQRIIVPEAFMESWSESYPHVDLRLAIKGASSWCLSNPGKRPKKDFARFLNGWFRRVKPGDQSYIDPVEQAADDADLIRQAMETFSDPDERADFFYRRSLRGLRVPPGVDCRPMPAEKEVAV